MEDSRNVEDLQSQETGDEFILPRSLFGFYCAILCVGTEWVHSGDGMRKRWQT